MKRFAVSAVEAPLPMLGGGLGKVYVLDTDRAAVLSGRKRTEPLVLRVNVGDCVQVKLTNATAGGAVAYKCDLPADPSTSDGVAAGYEPARSVASEQVQVFGVEGHEWPVEPGLKGTTIVSSTAVGGLEALTLGLVGGAGGRGGQPGDYVFGAGRGAYLEAGMWGLLRVLPKGAPAPGLEPL